MDYRPKFGEQTPEPPRVHSTEASTCVEPTLNLLYAMQDALSIAINRLEAHCKSNPPPALVTKIRPSRRRAARAFARSYDQFVRSIKNPTETGT
jgi:hypothetical protein